MEQDPNSDISKIEKKLKAFRARTKENTSSPSSKLSVSNVVIEIIAGVGTGGFIGYFADKFLGSFPAFFIICLILGFIAGGYIIYKTISKLDN